jgi:hypothetical protein
MIKFSVGIEEALVSVLIVIIGWYIYDRTNIEYRSLEVDRYGRTYTISKLTVDRETVSYIETTRTSTGSFSEVVKLTNCKYIDKENWDCYKSLPISENFSMSDYDQQIKMLKGSLWRPGNTHEHQRFIVLPLGFELRL